MGVLALVLTLAPAAGAQLLLQEQNVTVDSMVSDRFTWVDASGQLRKASLAHNDGQVHPVAGSRGGELRELQYETGAGTRVVRASGSGASGFGYVVSHPYSLANCVGGDSDLGHSYQGTFTRVFQGRHHAIFRFQQSYPRNCPNAPPGQQYLVPVTIDWVFATGRDHPLWALTWDLSGVPADRLLDDSRAPYGEILFDGAATEAGHSTIAGVAWGERYKFESTTNPVSYNSAWDYTPLNSVPYVKLWTTDVDATMGTVQTQTMSQQDAGGYYGIFAWGSSSAILGSACLGQGQDHVMPCDFNWPYQSINYSLDAFGDPNGTTFNTRLAWGTNFGFLGQTTYPVMGSADPSIGGPVGDGVDPNYGAENAYASGWPKKSYSTFVVLGLQSLDPVLAQRIQIETVQNSTLTATVGTVRTSGPAGVNRSDTVTYAPAGWNHVYAAWAVQAAGSAVDVNFDAGGGTLRHPLVIVSGWTTGLPSAVRFNGGALAQDVDYFPSTRAGELWLTLNLDLVGAINRLEIDPGAAPAVAGLSLVIRGTDNAIRHSRFDGATWGGFATLPGATADIPALASSGGGILDLVVRGIDDSVYHNHFDGTTWSGWTALPGATADIPALAASGGGALDLVVRGTDNGIYHNHYDGATWSGWTALPGATASIPALAASGGGALDLVVRGIDNGVYHNHYDGATWSGWVALPGATADIPALAASGGGVLDLVVRGIDNGVYHNHYAGGAWSGWVALPGATADIPALAASGGGILDLVVRGIDNGVYHNHYDGATWSGWVALPGATASIPALAASGGGLLDLAVRGTDNGVYHNHYDGAAWTGWIAVGGTTASRPALVIE
jgi:hypothetical protein